MTGGRLAVLAIGGNALIRDRKHESIPDQYDMVCSLAVEIAAMIESGWNVVVTHGNGPQVGFILRRSELSIHEVPPVPMDYAGADIQGAVGYMFVKALRNVFKRRRIKREAVAVVTQTVVDRNDPAFAKPSKPIGEFYSREQAEERMRLEHWAMVEDAGRGWRRVVASPRPVRIIESGVIRHLVEGGYVVVAAGGGGIPVVADEQGMLSGVAAVIDKDMASAVVAAQIGADLLVISTAVEKVLLNFGQPGQRALDAMTVAEARRYVAEGHFAPGSMLPKIEACIHFVEAGGREAIITCPDALAAALDGRSGTRMTTAPFS